jgi:hypothetical protein
MERFNYYLIAILMLTGLVVSTIVFSFPFSGTRPVVLNFSSRISGRKVNSRKYVLGFRENRLSLSLFLSIFVCLSDCLYVSLSFVRPSVYVFFSFFLTFSFSRLEFLFLMESPVIFLVPELRDENGNFF